MGAIWNVVDKFLAPFRIWKGKWMGVKAIPQGAIGDMKRLKGQAGGYMNDAKAMQDKAKGMQGKAQQAQGQMGQYQQQMGQYGQQGQQFQQQAGQFPPQAMGPPGMPPPGQFPGQFPQQPPPKAKKMGLFGRKKVCPQCGQPQEKTWDQCPYCMQAQMAAGPPGMGQNGPAAPQKTVAFMAGAIPGQAMQLLGWLVPLEGAQRGELFTLKPQTMVGTDPGQCDVVLLDPYMSSKHATIKAQAGVFVLEDLGSTNGTYVNDKRVTRHELVDNDLIRFGKTPAKFKSL